MIEGRKLSDWVHRMDSVEQTLCDAAVKQCRAVFKKLLPRAKGKALHDEDLKTEILLTVNLNLGDKPTVKVEGHVPPTIIECREY